MDINLIARMAGVSRATVSRYLNDGYVSQEKREAIRRVIDETGYVPSSQAKTLRTGKTDVVGVVLPKINSASVSRMVAGMTGVLNGAGYQLLLANTDNDAVRDAAALALRGARQPAYVGVLEEDVSAGRMRREGFLAACGDAGVEADADAMAVAEFTVDSGYEQTEALLDRAPDLDAIVCATDSIAYGALTCLREYGRRVPEDVSVTGVGDAELSQIVTPSLTTVHHHYKTSGAEAARMLVAMMGGDDAVPRELRMGYDVVAVTLGAGGAYVACTEGGAEVPGFAADAVDATGAGDSFWGGFLAAFCESGKAPEEVTLDDAVSFARLGNAVASLCVRKRGAIPAMPTREEAEALLAE